MSCGVIVKVGWMDKVVASFWPHFNVTIVENLFSSVNTANRPQLSFIEIQSVSSLLDNINGRYRPNRFLLHNISPKLLIYQLYFTKRGSQCKTEICREDRQRQTITDSIKKTSETTTTRPTIEMKKYFLDGQQDYPTCKVHELHLWHSSWTRPWSPRLIAQVYRSRWPARPDNSCWPAQYTYIGYTMSFSLWCRNKFSRNLIRLPVINISNDDLSVTEQINCTSTPDTWKICDTARHVFLKLRTCVTDRLEHSIAYQIWFTVCWHQLKCY